MLSSNKKKDYKDRSGIQSTTLFMDVKSVHFVLTHLLPFFFLPHSLKHKTIFFTFPLKSDESNLFRYKETVVETLRSHETHQTKTPGSLETLREITQSFTLNSEEGLEGLPGYYTMNCYLNQQNRKSAITTRIFQKEVYV